MFKDEKALSVAVHEFYSKLHYHVLKSVALEGETRKNWHNDSEELDASAGHYIVKLDSGDRVGIDHAFVKDDVLVLAEDTMGSDFSDILAHLARLGGALTVRKCNGVLNIPDEAFKGKEASFRNCLELFNEDIRSRIEIVAYKSHKTFRL